MRSLTTHAIDWAIDLVERGYAPDIIIRTGINALLKTRLNELQIDDCEQSGRRLEAFVKNMRQAPIAVATAAANAQHYEVPAEFFTVVLGESRKYSCCFWDAATADLNQAEINALRISSARAELEDGMQILELGCGWGAWTLWLARHYPAAHITAVSNSHSQRAYILQAARKEGLNNIAIITADMNTFDIDKQFDRVISIEMFEHIRNHELLMQRIAGWLKDTGKFFMHIFCHKSTPYYFIARYSSDWMSQYFFTGGMMPADELPLRFQQAMLLDKKWRWDGRHYKKTATAWLANMDANKGRVLDLFTATYGAEHAMQWWVRWRVFFIACAQLFGYENGQQWWVSHYLFTKAR